MSIEQISDVLGEAADMLRNLSLEAQNARRGIEPWAVFPVILMLENLDDSLSDIND